MAIHLYRCKECQENIWGLSDETLRTKLMWHLVRKHDLDMDVVLSFVRDWMGDDE